MNRRPSEVDARLVAWLEEGPRSGPEEVLSKTFARARSTRQDRVWLHRLTQPTRFHAMNTMLKFAAVAVFALAVGVAIGRSGHTARTPPRDPHRRRSPARRRRRRRSHIVSRSPRRRDLLPRQPQRLADTPLDRMTATVPEGWQGIRGECVREPLPDQRRLPGRQHLPVAPGQLLRRSVRYEAGLWDPPLGPTVDDFVTALATVPGYTTTEPTDVEFLGYKGKYIEEVGPPSVTQCADGFSHPWQTKYNETAPYDFDDQHARLWVLDIDGVRLVITLVGSDAAPHPTGTDPADLAQQQAVFDSLRIAPAPAPTASPSASPAIGPG